MPQVYCENAKARDSQDDENNLAETGFEKVLEIDETSKCKTPLQNSATPLSTEVGTVIQMCNYYKLIFK